MSNLVSDLGAGYVNDFFNGAFFEYKDRIMYVREVSSSALFGVDVTDPNDHHVEAIPAQEVTDFGFFKYPRLGYRCLDKGTVLLSLWRTRTTRRGLKQDNVGHALHNCSRALHGEGVINSRHYSPRAMDFSRFGHMIYKPEFLSIAPGLNEIESGERVSFAISPDLAVAPNYDVPYLELLYRGGRAGTISANRKLDLSTRLPPSAMAKLEGLSNVRS